MLRPPSPVSLAVALGVALALVSLYPGSPLAAQMIRTETPLGNASDSFYEQMGVGFSFSIPTGGNVVGLGLDGQPTANGAINFSFGVPNGVVPPFGGFDPNSNANFGIGYLGRNGGAFGLNMTMGQGSDRSYTQTTPILVLTNGSTGSVSDTIQRPFVTSFIPVVGDDDVGPADPERQGRAGRSARPRVEPSSATTADLSVAEIQRRKRKRKAAEIAALLAKAQEAEADGKLATAKIHLRNAARRANGDRRREILDELERLTRDE